MTSSKPILRKVLWPVLAALVVLGLYSAGWFWMASRIRHEVEGTVASLGRNGIEAECANLTVTGYPLRLAVACDGLAYEDDAANVAASSGELNAVTTILSPLSATAALSGPLRTAAPGMEPLWIDWDHLNVYTDRTLWLPGLVRLTAEGLSGQTDPQEGDPVSLFSAGSAEALLTRNGPDIDYDGDLKDVEIDAGAIGGRVLPAFDARGKMTLKDGTAMAEAGAWSLRGSAIRIGNLELTSGDAAMTLSGPLSFRADGLIDAKLKIRLNNPEAVADVLAGAIPEQEREIRQGFAALALLGSEPTIPLVISKGKVSLGFVPLGRIPAIGE